MTKQPVSDLTLDTHPSFLRAMALPEPLRSHFPKSREEADHWQPLVRYRALASCVLVVATTRIECAGIAYIDAVPGGNNNQEFDAVLRHGAKLHQALARILWPEFDEVPYAR